MLRFRLFFGKMAATFPVKEYQNLVVMKPKTIEHEPQRNLFRPELIDIVDPKHELVLLADRIDWDACEAYFGKLYKPGPGRPPLPTRMMVGLHLIKHMEKLSDEASVKRWLDSPYVQYFCGEQYFQHEIPMDPTSMTRFRKRIGEQGAEQLLKLSIDAGLKTGTIKPESLKTAVIDTTVMEKAIAHPSDSKLLQKSRERLVALAREKGVKLRQTYEKEFGELSYKASRYAHARQMNRLKRTNRKMATRVGRLIRELLNKVPTEQMAGGFLDTLTRASTAIRQAVDPGMRTADKIFAFHAPEVACIRKGKARKPNEFGCKVSVMTTAKEGFVLCSHAMHGNPYDGHTVNRSLLKMHSVTGTLPRAVLADRGYKGSDRNCLFSHVHITGRKRGLGKAHELQHRRNSIEPIIGHMKNDGLMHRNWLKGEMGDKINAVLCGAGQNLRMVLKKLRELLCACIFWPLSAVISEVIHTIRLLLQRHRMAAA